MFSQITVKLDATNVSPGNGIQSINPATISRHRTANNSINLSDGTITYSASDIGSRTLDFSGNPTTSAVWTAKPALIVIGDGWSRSSSVDFDEYDGRVKS
jgi:hypothetical protein